MQASPIGEIASGERGTLEPLRTAEGQEVVMRMSAV